jgi:hypothetical protein
MSRILLIAISTICTCLIISNLNRLTESRSKNLVSNPKKHEIKISGHLSYLMNSSEQTRYKHLFKASIDGDLRSLKELIRFDCGGGSRCYGHGAIIFEIVEHIGEEPFIAVISSMNAEERLWLEALLNFGLEYAEFDEKHDSIILKDKFPKIGKVLDFYNGK